MKLDSPRFSLCPQTPPFSLHPAPDSRRLFLQLNNHKIFRHSTLLQSSHFDVKCVAHGKLKLVCKDMSTMSLILVQIGGHSLNADRSGNDQVFRGHF